MIKKLFVVFIILLIYLQNQQLELDLLLERVNEITQQADQRNKENIQAQSDKVTEEWNSLVSELESRRDTLTGLAQVNPLCFVNFITNIEENTFSSG